MANFRYFTHSFSKKTFNFNFFEKYGQFKLLIAKKDVKCKIKIGTLQN